MFIELIYKNIRHYSYRYIFILLITFFVNMSVLVSQSFINDMKAGINEARDRLGADLVLLPKSDETIDAESILFYGSPSTMVMDNVTKDIQSIAGVDMCVSRLYLASLSGQSCCDGSIQIIATDIQNDFMLRPYMNGIHDLLDNEIILGSKFSVDIGDTVKYFNREFIVRDVLTKSNTGIDDSGFINLNMACQIINDPEYKEEYFSQFTDDSTSMIFVRTSNPQLTYNIIKSTFKNISVYVPDKKIAEYTKSVTAISDAINILIMILIIVGMTAIICITLISTETRRNEFGSLILMGYKKTFCFIIFMTEHAIIELLATMLATISFFIYRPMLSTWLSVKFSIPMTNTNDVKTIVFVFMATIVFSIMATIISTAKINRTSPSVLIKEAS